LEFVDFFVKLLLLYEEYRAREKNLHGRAAAAI
jgi:hypothetical protein